MKRILFYLTYAASLFIPAAIYLGTFGWAGDPYPLSILLGTVAFMIFANQLILAAKPRFAVDALGTKGLLSFHGTMPVVAVLIAVFHRLLKVGLFPGGEPTSEMGTFLSALFYGVGFSDDTLQAQLGTIALALFFLLVLVAAFLMANTFWMKIPFFKGLKEKVYAALKLNYPKMRTIHNLTVIAFILILVHILLASTSSFGANPIGESWMILWAVFSFGIYLRYRIAGRKSPAKPKT